jgi:uncharacterized protein YegJ (DUF2314 family)
MALAGYKDKSSKCGYDGKGERDNKFDRADWKEKKKCPSHSLDKRVVTRRTVKTTRTIAQPTATIPDGQIPNHLWLTLVMHDQTRLMTLRTNRHFQG